MFPQKLSEDLNDALHTVWSIDQIMRWIAEALGELVNTASAGLTLSTFPISSETGDVTVSEFIPKIPLSVVDIHNRKVRNVFIGNGGRITCGSSTAVRTTCGYRISPPPPFEAEHFLVVRGLDVNNVPVELQGAVSQWVIHRAAQMDSGDSDVATNQSQTAVSTYAAYINRRDRAIQNERKITK